MRKVFLFCLALLALLPAVAKADLVFYATRAQFNAATTAQTNIDFEGLAANGGFTFYATPPGVTISGANFNIDHSGGNNGNLYAIGQGFYYPGTSVLSSQQSSNGINNLVVTLPGGYTAFAVDLGSFFGTNFTFTLSNGDVFNYSTSSLPGFTFAGFTSTVAISSVRMESFGNEVMNFDNVSFGTAVPVPSGLVLGGMGALGLTGLLWRRRKATNKI